MEYNDGLESEVQKTAIVTSSGIRYSPFFPRIEDIKIKDIARSLSFQCRYAGHVRRFYSVAEHSIYVSHLVPKKFALEGLLHDACEAYCQDLAAPVKKFLKDYSDLEQRNDMAIRVRFGLPPSVSHEVHVADQLLGQYERTTLTEHHNDDEYRFKDAMVKLSQYAREYRGGESVHIPNLWSEETLERLSNVEDTFLERFFQLTANIRMEAWNEQSI